jgi:ABC-type hemin transport system ATPase subunit
MVSEHAQAAMADEMAAVLSPNGAGKSTLFRAITGRPTPATGSVRLLGAEVAALRAANAPD